MGIHIGLSRVKHYKKIEYIEVREELDKITCDICGKEFFPETSKKDIVSYNQVCMSHTKGFIYDAYGDYHDGRITLTLDICGACFRDRIKPFLKNIGVEIQYRDAEGDTVEDPDED